MLLICVIYGLLLVNNGLVNIVDCVVVVSVGDDNVRNSVVCVYWVCVMVVFLVIFVLMLVWGYWWLVVIVLGVCLGLLSDFDSVDFVVVS